MKRIYTYCVRRCLLQSKFTAEYSRNIRRNISSTPRLNKMKGSMQAWQIHRYGGNDELVLSRSVSIPKMKSPNDVLIKVHAASINPIDCRMRDGYGSTALNAIRQKSAFPRQGKEFPLVLGRDFSGEVVEIGKKVGKFRPGDQVWGTVFSSKQGCLAEYTVAEDHEVSRKPSSISHTEASSIPYVACTVTSALSIMGSLKESSIRGKRVLVFGGSGGIGTFAIQLLKSYGADVTTTCSTDAIQLVSSLGADAVIDYKTQDIKEELSKMERFDIILDSFGKEITGYAENFLRSSKTADSRYITLKHPFLQNFDDLGIVGGGIKSLAVAASDTIMGLQKGISHRWAVYLPMGKALDRISELVDDDQIIPVIDKVFPFEDVPAAFEKVEKGHARGKTVVQLVEEQAKQERT